MNMVDFIKPALLFFLKLLCSLALAIGVYEFFLGDLHPINYAWRHNIKRLEIWYGEGFDILVEAVSFVCFETVVIFCLMNCFLRRKK